MVIRIPSSRCLLWAILFFCCVWQGGRARTWTADDLPIPYLQDRTQYVSNPDHILQSATVDSINFVLAALERDKGIQSLIVVVENVPGADPYEFGMALGRKYGVGNKKTRTGLIVVLAKDDRRYHFLTGNGLEATLPDALVQRIEDNIFLPRLKMQDWDGAMLQAIKAIDHICRGDDMLPQSTLTEGGDDSVWLPFLAMALLLLMFGGIAFYGNRVKKRPRKCPRCGQKTYYYVDERLGRSYRNGEPHLIKIINYRCRNCDYHYSDRMEYPDRDTDAIFPGVLAGTLLGCRGRSGWYGGPFGGGGFSGGSFGGGSFGGGGSGGRF